MVVHLPWHVPKGNNFLQRLAIIPKSRLHLPFALPSLDGWTEHNASLLRLDLIYTPSL